MTSATAACCPGLRVPEPTPDRKEATAKIHTLSVNPITAVITPASTSPLITSGLRPTESEIRPENDSATAEPAANTVSATPDRAGPAPKTAEAISGISATRIPMEVHPLAKPETSEARYAPNCQASRKLMRTWALAAARSCSDCGGICQKTTPAASRIAAP